MPNRKSAIDDGHPRPTLRDLDIVRAVHQHGQMTRRQIQRLFFRRNGKLASDQAVCRRLAILTRRQYLDRARLPTAMGSGPYVYWPGRWAAAALSTLDAPLVRRRTRARRIRRVADLAHVLEIVDCYISLKEALWNGGGRILEWLGESEAHHVFTLQGTRRLFSPDAYCLWSISGDEGAFFLEWDRGTESISRFAEKMTRYHEYYRARAYHEHLGEMGLRPRMLIAVPDKRREDKIAVWIDRRLASGALGALPTVLLSQRDAVLCGAMAPIWRKPGAEDRIRFVD